MYPPRKQKRSSKEIRQQLKTIYAQQDGKIPDLTHLEKRSSSHLTSLLLKIIAVLCVLSAAAWIGFFLWTQAIFQEGDDLSITIEGPGEVIAGEKVYYTIRYENLQRVDLEQMTLVVNLPDTFVLLEASPEYQKEYSWDIGTLPKESDGSLVIGGLFRSEVGTTETLQVLITYRPSNTHSNFQKIQTQYVTVPESILNIALTGPENALSGDSISYVIDVQNTSAQKAEKVGIQLLVPDSFQVTSTEPTLKEDADGIFWREEELDGQELSSFTIHGQYTTEAEDSQKITAQTVFLDENDEQTIQAQSEMETEVLAGTLAFHIIINGSTQAQVVDLGETLRISIDYENTGPEALEDLQFSLEIETEDTLYSPIDWTNARIENASRSGRVLTWDKTSVEDFVSLEPGKSGVLDLTLPLYTVLDPDEADQFSLHLRVDMGELDRTIEASPIPFQISSDLELSSQTRYYSESGSPIGSGSLPLSVDQTTKLVLFWNLTNALHDVKTITVSTTLPSTVNWEEHTQADIGTLTYNPVTRMVTWSIDSLPKTIPEASAFFEVGVTPSLTDVGNFIKLTNQTFLSATDTMTQSALTQTINFQSSDLSDDPFSEESGVVVE
ncbi:hypothetical protein A2239_00720 [Candidatus Uhrbacteria bacterium RIFOXYA2_FULL_40_9]|nr:MAG: hypothetical protein UT94_C0006G0017 [Candidatus Uhrbacteria bacterium GW2011_GWF2_40_263]OGL92650.1 MAG: hypothetical protein A2239_00720 [Candidatus Uhrbacteria bacterium RIFOXYA2_FULL_40_9]OGL96704.1 MAG: hypothetical protein A2332_02590 [Candidatus Uhrbacteria bacterium RIFOXYB2_FULL_41_18]HBK34677.1 hypothetical protein [Candidatus Uhrbacteria bacterium]HCB56087.1 hypothetical protein [Candidatus Uhrbacteria bacterium]